MVKDGAGAVVVVIVVAATEMSVKGVLVGLVRIVWIIVVDLVVLVAKDDVLRRSSTAAAVTTTTTATTALTAWNVDRIPAVNRMNEVTVG